MLGKQQHISFGTYPEISLKDARELRDKARSLVAKGIDPRSNREGTKPMQSAPGVPTFAEFAERWKDFKLKQLSARLIPAAQNKRNGRQGTKEQIERYLRLDMLPLLGHQPPPQGKRQHEQCQQGEAQGLDVGFKMGNLVFEAAHWLSCRVFRRVLQRPERLMRFDTPRMSA